MRQSTGQASQVMMPSPEGRAGSVISRLSEGGAHAVGGRRYSAQPHARRVIDGVENGGRRRDQRRLADALGAVGAERFRILYEEAFDGRHVAEGRNEIVVEILGAARQILLHEGEADALRDAAMDLPLDLARIDGAADIMRGDDAAKPDGAEAGIDLDLGHLRREG